VNNPVPIVRLFSKRVAKKVKLLKVLKMRNELQQFLEITQLVITGEKHV
jgi:hypothetical protein